MPAAEADAQGDSRGANRRQGARIASSPTHLRGAAQGCRFAMKLDLLLFGRIRSGPFFALLVKE